MSFLNELCFKSKNCLRTLPKTEFSVANSLVYGVVARRSSVHELSHDYVVDEWCIALPHAKCGDLL